MMVILQTTDFETEKRKIQISCSANFNKSETIESEKETFTSQFGYIKIVEENNHGEPENV